MKYVVTIATGSEYYVRLAENLAISFLYWHPGDGIRFALLTDQPGKVSERIRDRIRVIDISGGAHNGFLSKFSLVDYLQDGQVIFLDSDCLIYGDLEVLFRKYEGKGFVALGKNHTSGEGIGYCRSVPELLNTLSLPWYPIVTGSLYYYDDFKLARRVIDYARSKAGAYDHLGFIRLRGKPNEEPLIGIGMAVNGVQALHDDGLAKGDIMYFDRLRSDAIKGQAFLWNLKQPKVPFVNDLMESRPLVVHFDGINVQFYPYISEVRMLRLWFDEGYSPERARRRVLISYKWPNELVAKIKDIFRPLYHTLMGPRRIPDSMR